ncbi:MAG: hypothetical protein V4813_18335 [Gemmatimonadota bacterium]
MTTPRSRVMAVLTVLAMLGIGVAIGIAVDRSLLHRGNDARNGGRGSGRGGGPLGSIGEPVDTANRNRMRARIVKRITDDLALTPAQASAVDAIFARRELQLDSLRARVGPQLDSLRDQMRASMDSVLTPEQRAKSAESRKRMDERRRSEEARQREERRGPDKRD